MRKLKHFKPCDGPGVRTDRCLYGKSLKVSKAASGDNVIIDVNGESSVNLELDVAKELIEVLEYGVKHDQYPRRNEMSAPEAMAYMLSNPGKEVLTYDNVVKTEPTTYRFSQENNSLQKKVSRCGYCNVPLGLSGIKPFFKQEDN